MAMPLLAKLPRDAVASPKTIKARSSAYAAGHGYLGGLTVAADASASPKTIKVRSSACTAGHGDLDSLTADWECATMAKPLLGAHSTERA